MANEFIDIAAKNYRANHPEVVLCTQDVRQVSASTIRGAIGDIEIDLLDGSPPCSAFSSSGTGEKYWNKDKVYSGKTQRVDDLFFEYSRLLKELKPRAFIAENVIGLTQGKAKGYFNLILRELRSAGYNVKAFILNASSYGVPQTRQRLFFIGIREDLGVKEITPPPHDKKISVIRDFDELLDIRAFMATAPGKWLIAEGRPYGTVTARIGKLYKTAYMSCNGFVRRRDGSENKLTIQEGKALCSFPRDFHLQGTFEEQFERLGRSVPPVLMANLSKHVEGWLK